MNLLLIAVSSFMLALSGALVPGPLFTITVSASARRGFIAGPLIILGHGILELLVVAIVLLGAAPYLLSGNIKYVVSLAGGAVLVLMGAMMLRDAGRARLVFEASGQAGSGLHPVAAGMLGSISNPYWILWWLTVGLGYLLSAMHYGIPGVAAFFAGHISADLSWYSLISFTVSKGRKMLGDRGYRFLLFGCSAFLIFFGIWFIIMALK